MKARRIAAGMAAMQEFICFLLLVASITQAAVGQSSSNGSALCDSTGPRISCGGKCFFVCPIFSPINQCLARSCLISRNVHIVQRYVKLGFLIGLMKVNGLPVNTLLHAHLLLNLQKYKLHASLRSYIL